MRLSLVVETGDSVRDSVGESIGIGEGSVGELMLLEVAPASLDIIQFGGVFRQPFGGEPGAQRPGAFGGAVGGAELVEQGNEVGRALGGAGMHQKVPADRIE